MLWLLCPVVRCTCMPRPETGWLTRLIHLVLSAFSSTSPGHHHLCARLTNVPSPCRRSRGKASSSHLNIISSILLTRNVRPGPLSHLDRPQRGNIVQKWIPHPTKTLLPIFGFKAICYCFCSGSFYRTISVGLSDAPGIHVVVTATNSYAAVTDSQPLRLLNTRFCQVPPPQLVHDVPENSVMTLLINNSHDIVTR